ncbi:MAG: hypothetical protein V1921_02295 [Candidatus Altiarchaeota archaeon]
MIVAVDQDDVLMVPGSMGVLQAELNLREGEKKAIMEVLRDYKRGKATTLDVHAARYNILKGYPRDEILEALERMSARIPEESRKFVKKVKNFADVYIVSNSDVSIVEEIAKSLDIDSVAENRFLFELKFVTNRKSEMLIRRGITPDVVITDDPLNESDFLDMGKLGIVMARRDNPVTYSEDIRKKYFFVNSLEEAHDKIVSSIPI